MDFLLFLEGFRSPVLDTIFRLITQLGEQSVLIVIFCVIFWCINKRMAYVMGLTFFSSALVVQSLKVVFRVPRPWVANPGFQPVEGSVYASTGYSFPSGHTQAGAALWGSLGVQLSNKAVKTICFAIALLVGFSRLYLGVHYPSDVIVSLLITFVFVFLASKFISEEPISIGKELILPQILFVASMLAFCLAIYQLTFTDTEVSQVRDVVIAAGSTTGFAVGMFIERNFIKFSVKSKNIFWHTLKFVIGIAVTLGLQEGLKIFGTGLVMDAIRYFIIVSWITMGYPLIIKKWLA